MSGEGFNWKKLQCPPQILSTTRQPFKIDLIAVDIDKDLAQ